jgi:hypothetical protein
MLDLRGLQNACGFSILCAEAVFVTVIVLYVFARAGYACSRITNVFTSGRSAGVAITNVCASTGSKTNKGCASRCAC